MKIKACPLQGEGTGRGVIEQKFYIGDDNIGGEGKHYSRSQKTPGGGREKGKKSKSCGASNFVIVISE